jgi:hypothetical protein
MINHGNNKDLKDYAGRTILYRPIIIVEMDENNEPFYRLRLNELDERLNEPGLFGIVLSDLIYHIAHAYSHVTDRDQRDIEAEIAEVCRQMLMHIER